MTSLGRARTVLFMLVLPFFIATASAQEPAPSPSPHASPTPEPSPQSPAGTDVPPGAAGAGGKVFNPDIAVIGDFLGAVGKNPSTSAPPSLEMHEAEASFQAIVDPYARADFFLTFGPDEVGVEEGFITFTSLPANLLLKVGKMRASFGKVNQMHNHILPWTDRPLVVEDLVGGEDGISDAGLSLARLFPNRFLFLEAIGEVYRGESNLFRAPERGDLTYVGRLRGYRDLTESTNLDAGVSVAQGHNETGPSFKTRLWGADLTFRYRPLRRAIYRRLLARTELIWSQRDQPGGPAHAFGAYGSVEHQFARRWFGGVRLDRSERADDPGSVDKAASLLLTYWPSEFSQIRGQLRHIRYGEGQSANELLFQVQFSIGAHGAHTF